MADSNPQPNVSRRIFLSLGAAASVAALIHYRTTAPSVEASSTPQQPKDIRIMQFNDAGVSQGLVTVQTVVKADADWRKQLAPDAYSITRQANTEYPYSGKYWNNHDKGLYRCIDCATALFNADTKFESGTGWPSFYQPIAKENVLEITDRSLGMARTAVSCARCEAHLGHVFDDGPQPTGLRYCMNSAALSFTKFA